MILVTQFNIFKTSKFKFIFCCLEIKRGGGENSSTEQRSSLVHLDPFSRWIEYSNRFLHHFLFHFLFSSIFNNDAIITYQLSFFFFFCWHGSHNKWIKTEYFIKLFNLNITPVLIFVNYRVVLIITLFTFIYRYIKKMSCTTCIYDKLYDCVWYMAYCKFIRLVHTTGVW